MNDRYVISALFRVLAADDRITVWHFSIYLNLFNKWMAQGYVNPILISRREIVEQTHIGSIVTYHKCIKQLSEFGYINYEPSYNPFIGSTVGLLVPAKLRDGA